MKILHIITDTNIGGAGTHLLTLLDAIDRKIFTLDAVLPKGSKLITELANRDVNYITADNIAEKSFSHSGCHELVSLIKDIRPDIVHTHASFSGRIAARLCKRPIIYTRHSVFEPPPKTTRFPLKNIMGLTNRIFSDKIIAVSPAAKENLIRQGTPRELIKVIFNGVPPTKQYSAAEKTALRHKYNISEESFVISHIARLDDIKGHDYTLDAAKMWQNDLSIICVIAGSGPMETHLRKRIKNEAIKNVIMPGFVQPIGDLLNITDLQINASYGSEATSYALLEGMSLGIPMVVSDFGGNPFVVTNMKNGLLFPQKDGKALGEAVLKIKNDRGLYHQLSQEASEEYNKRFRADIMAREIEKLYRSFE